MNRLLILDGNALLHRAYHALPPLTTSNGKPGGAIYGFIGMLIRLQTDLHPVAYAVTFDRPAPTFRKKLFKEYQSQRPEMEEALSSQISVVHEAMSAFKIPVFEMDGYEADDVIGTFVKTVTNQKVDGIDQTIIVTGDRDILQLVEDEKILVYMPVKGLSEAKLYGEKDVIERLGVPPNRVTDWKAFCGDSSDNYPGVPGIGPKTAADLVNTYGTMEDVFEAIEAGTATVSAKLKEKLLAGKESAILSKNLATIRTDAPITIDVERLFIPSFDTIEVRALLSEFGFPSLLKRIQKSDGTFIDEKQNSEKVKQKKEVSTSDQMDLFSKE